MTGIAIGQQIAIDRETFARLAEAFFVEIEKKYPVGPRWAAAGLIRVKIGPARSG